MKLSDNLDIKTYKDWQEKRIIAFKLIEDVINEMIKETIEKNPTFLIKDYDKLVSYKMPLDENIYVIPIKDNKPLKVVFE